MFVEPAAVLETENIITIEQPGGYFSYTPADSRFVKSSYISDLPASTSGFDVHFHNGFVRTGQKIGPLAQ
jgi:hypothetical protein